MIIDVADAISVSSESSIEYIQDEESIIMQYNQLFNPELIDIIRYIDEPNLGGPQAMNVNLDDSGKIFIWFSLYVFILTNFSTISISGIVDLTDSDDDEVYAAPAYIPLQAPRLLVDYSESETEDADPTEPTGCPICLKTLANRAPYMIRPCNHFICSKCLEKCDVECIRNGR